MDKETLLVLKSIGLTDGEAKVFQALIRLKTSSVSKIINLSNVSASKVYFILEKLTKKGLITMTVKDKIRIYSAANPGRILDYLEEKEKEIQEQKREARRVIEKLQSSEDSYKNHPPAEFSQGKNGFETIINEVIHLAKEGNHYLAIAGSRMAFVLQDYWYRHSQLLSEKKIVQLIAYEKSVWFDKDPEVHQRQKRKLYFPRFLSEEYKDLPSIQIIGDNVVISDIDENDEVFCLMVRNTNLSTSMRKLIKAIYLSGKVPEKYIAFTKEINTYD